MTTNTEPMAVYSGEHTEALFLKSLLEGSGIPAWLIDLSVRGVSDVRVYVAHHDFERARPIAEHFRVHGKKTAPPW